MSAKITLKEWLPVLGMTCSAFIFNTSEFMPVALLTDIARDFTMSEALAGSMISIYAWVVTLMSLPLMLLVCKMEFKKLLLIVIGVFCASQIASAMAPSFMVLLLSRIGVACSHAIFWSIAAPMAVRAIAPEHKAFALSMIVTGSSVAVIFGLPLGRIIGLSLGWRMTFICVGILSFLIIVYLSFVFPKLENRSTFSLKKLPELLKSRALIGIYILTLAVSTSYFTSYSYIEPYLKQVALLSDDAVTSSLIIFGVFGIVGSMLFTRLYDKKPQAFITGSTALIAISLILLHASTISFAGVIVIAAIWGMSATAFNVALQAEIIKQSSQESTAIAMSVFSGIFNLGIGCGTLFGGAVSTYMAIDYIGYVGGIIALAATLYAALKLGRII
ncbi:Sugar efflux transporter [Anaerobiospirillum thomasii]|uniref:sugar transporter n=1 Tax=Anaerobiospirillum thomasii TaxID=179995 RepID=UPI000D8E6BB5|nr:sugar transporter [Anaerobiospirillum thomasii]SPT67757.1 Sugar efflux transporter [Anaerobiospirillum thomasii]